MTKIDTPLKDCYIIEPQIFRDERGYFFESFNQKKFNDLVQANITFVQDNQSKSTKGVLRGLHYQTTQTQGKLVSVIKGEVYDVAVDLRQDSPTFGKSFGVHLSEENKKLFWVPPGFAHGFLVLSETAEFFYKVTDYYHPGSDVSLKWSDPELNIQWPKTEGPFLKDKDANGQSFKNCPKF